MSNKAGQFARFLSEQIFLLKNRTIMSRWHLLDKLPVDNRTYFLESISHSSDTSARLCFFSSATLVADVFTPAFCRRGRGVVLSYLAQSWKSIYGGWTCQHSRPGKNNWTRLLGCAGLKDDCFDFKFEQIKNKISILWWTGVRETHFKILVERYQITLFKQW